MRAGSVLALLIAASAGSAAAQPSAGRYSGELCVATGEAPAQCGPAAVTLRQRAMSVQIADIVYRLALHSSQLDVVLMHGAMQIDGFTANYEWDGPTLVFRDPDKAVSYRIRVADKRP